MICPRCGANNPDGSAVCGNCGLQLVMPQQPQQPQGMPEQPAQQPAQYQQPMYQYYQPQPQIDPTDHTAEYEAKDISDNKIFAMLPYLIGLPGMIICLLAAQKSGYAMFHVREAAKLYVTEMLLAVCCIIPIIGWIFAGVMMVVLTIVEIIMFISVCKGKAKEAPVVKKLKFLK